MFWLSTGLLLEYETLAVDCRQNRCTSILTYLTTYLPTVFSFITVFCHSIKVTIKIWKVSTMAYGLTLILYWKTSPRLGFLQRPVRGRREAPSSPDGTRNVDFLEYSYIRANRVISWKIRWEIFIGGWVGWVTLNTIYKLGLKYSKELISNITLELLLLVSRDSTSPPPTHGAPSAFAWNSVL